MYHISNILYCSKHCTCSRWVYLFFCRLQYKFYRSKIFKLI
jgi:hypothetical protein